MRTSFSRTIKSKPLVSLQQVTTQNNLKDALQKDSVNTSECKDVSHKNNDLKKVPLPKSEMSDLDHNLAVAQNLRGVLPDIWQKLMLLKLKNERELKHIDQNIKMGMTTIYFQRYQRILNNFIQKIGWQEIKAYVGDQINRFAYDYDSQILSSHLQVDAKAPALLFYILNELRNNLTTEESRFFFDNETIKAKIAQINKLLGTITFLVKKIILSQADFQIHDARFVKAAQLKKMVSDFIKSTEEKWAPYDNLPVLRPVLLITIANMYHSLLLEAHNAVDAANPKLQHIIQSLKHEMEKIAEVMLWQEQLFQKTQDPDLFIQFLDELFGKVSPDLNNPAYNVNDLECRANLWANVDSDLPNLFKEYAKKNTQDWVLEYLNFIPKDCNPHTLSKFRREFIMLYASEQSKQTLEKMLYEKSSKHIGIKISQLLQENPSYQGIFKNMIGDYCKNCCKMGPAREYLFQLSHYSEIIDEEKKPAEVLLDNFPKLKKVFGKERVNEAAEEIIALRNLFLNITDPVAWEKVLTLCENSRNHVYKDFICHLVTHAQRLETELKKSNQKLVVDEFKISIQSYVEKTYQFNIAAIPKPNELKHTDQHALHVEVALLHQLYWDITSKDNWMNAMNVKLFAQGELSQGYLDTISSMIWKTQPIEFRIQLRCQWRLCQQYATQFAFQKRHLQIMTMAKHEGRMNSLFENTKGRNKQQVKTKVNNDDHGLTRP